MACFPTEQRLQEYGRALDGSGALDDLARGWGERFDGGVLLVIEDPPLEEIRLGDLPAEVETAHSFEGRSGSSADRVLDQGVRQPAALQRTAERQFVRTLDLF